MTDFLRLIGEKPWPELDAYLETMVIMMTCDGSNDPRELALFVRIGEDLQRYHIPSFGAIDLKARYEAFNERLKAESVGKRLDSIAASLPSRAARMMALFFAMKISSADLRLVPAERAMLNKMQGHFQLSDQEYADVTAAYKQAMAAK